MVRKNLNIIYAAKVKSMKIENKLQFKSLNVEIRRTLFEMWESHQNQYAEELCDSKVWYRKIEESLNHNATIVLELNDKDVVYFLYFKNDSEYRNFYVKFLFIADQYRKSYLTARKILHTLSNEFYESQFDLFRCSTNHLNKPMKQMLLKTGMNKCEESNRKVEYYSINKKNFFENNIVKKIGGGTK